MSSGLRSALEVAYPARVWPDGIRAEWHEEIDAGSMCVVLILHDLFYHRQFRTEFPLRQLISP